MSIQIKKLSDDAVVPTRGSEGAAGYDLYSTHEGMIPPNSSTMFHTGIAMSIPKGYYGLVAARSGMGIKRGLTPRNKIGVIDSDFVGEIMVCLRNDGENDWQKIEKGDRIAQIIITPYCIDTLEVVDELADTDRGTDGFGSTGR